MLRAVPNPLAGESKPPLNVPSTDADSTICGYCVVCQTLENSRFPSAIDSEQSKTLPLVQTEGDIVDSRQVVAETSFKDFFELCNSDRHIFRFSQGYSFFFFKHIIILFFRIVNRYVAVSVLDLPTRRLETPLAYAVEASGPAITVDYDFEEQNEEDSDTSVAS